MIIDVTNTIGKHKFRPEVKVESLIEKMDTHGVDMAVAFCYAESLDNESVESAIKQYPDRIIGLYTVNPWDSNGEAKLKDALDNRGFKGLKLDPVRHGFLLNEHEAFYPLLQICSDKQVPVWCFGAGEVFCCPILFERIAKDFPKLKIIMGEMGFQYDSSSAASVASRNDNIYLETSASMFASLPRALRSAGVDRTLMGTGTPDIGVFDLEIMKIRMTLPNDKEAQDKILGLNAARLFGIK